jgi:hypothetical protein
MMLQTTICDGLGDALLLAQPFQYDADLLLGRKCRRVARRMCLIASSAGCFSGPDFCLIFAPYGYEDPEILPTRKPPAGSKALTADTPG